MSQYACLGLPLVHAGKVRELYRLPDDAGAGRLLMVATDDISAFDHVLPTPVPDKGAILTSLSLWWFDRLADIAPNHVVSADVSAFGPGVQGRALVCEELEMVPLECVARGYLTGSGWAEYRRSRSVCGVGLPSGLRDGDQLPEPIFTPALKAGPGAHDENVDFEAAARRCGRELVGRLRDLTLAVYSRAARIASERGVILADTKLEFGLRPDGAIVLADEVLTPDSSRFWDSACWRPGGPQPSFDKQYVRDWLAHESGWRPSSDEPPPPLPARVVAATRERYLEAHLRLTGMSFVPAAHG